LPSFPEDTDNDHKKKTSVIATVQPGARVEDILDEFLPDGESNNEGEYGYAGALGPCGKLPKADGSWVVELVRVSNIGAGNRQCTKFRIVLADGSVKTYSSESNNMLRHVLLSMITMVLIRKEN
jgi:hypothetical protein